MDLKDCGKDENFGPFLVGLFYFYVLYVTFIHDTFLSNAVHIVCDTVARPTSLRIGNNLS